jgi:hypothetical protein
MRRHTRTSDVTVLGDVRLHLAHDADVKQPHALIARTRQQPVPVGIPGGLLYPALVASSADTNVESGKTTLRITINLTYMLRISLPAFGSQSLMKLSWIHCTITKHDLRVHG